MSITRSIQGDALLPIQPSMLCRDLSLLPNTTFIMPSVFGSSVHTLIYARWDCQLPPCEVVCSLFLPSMLCTLGQSQQALKAGEITSLFLYSGAQNTEKVASFDHSAVSKCYLNGSPQLHASRES